MSEKEKSDEMLPYVAKTFLFIRQGVLFCGKVSNDEKNCGYSGIGCGDNVVGAVMRGA